MSGLEVVGIVAGIASAFTSATTLYRAWRKKRREGDEREENNQLETTVSRAGRAVQRRYDDDYRRLGQTFARGDDAGRIALMEQLLAVQQTVIALLNNNNTPVNPIPAFRHPNHDAIYRSSQNVQTDTVRALGDLFQRLSQARPIAPTGSQITGQLALPWHDSTPEIINNGFNCFAPVDTKLGYFGSSPRSSCQKCGWKVKWNLSGMPWASWSKSWSETRDNRKLGTFCAVQKFHCNDKRAPFRCFICKCRLLTSEDLQDHVEQCHTWAEICNGRCQSGDICGDTLRNENV